MGTYVTTNSSTITTVDGAYTSAPRRRTTRSTGYVSGTNDTAPTGAYVCSNLK